MFGLSPHELRSFMAPYVAHWGYLLVGVTGPRLERTEKVFERYGPLTVFMARFVGGLRFMAGPMAGILGMPFPRFFRYNLAGATVYCPAIVLLAYFSAHLFDGVVHLIAMANWVLALLVLVVTLGAIGWWLWRVRLQYGKG